MLAAPDARAWRKGPALTVRFFVHCDLVNVSVYPIRVNRSPAVCIPTNERNINEITHNASVL